MSHPPMVESRRTFGCSTQASTHTRVTLKKILRSVQAGNCCRVLGPRFRGKSRLIRDAVSALYASGTHYTSYQSLEDVSLVDEPSFFNSLYAGIERDFLLAQGTESKERPGHPHDFQYALTRLVRQSDRNLALFIDDLEMAPPNLVAFLLGALRAVFTTVVDRPGARFQAVVCGSLSFNQLELYNASRFENISDLILVGDLDEGERLDLARTLCKDARLTATTKGLEALLRQTSGDRFLIERVAEICFEQMALEGKQRVTQARIAEAVKIFLDRRLDNWKVAEVLKQIESNPNLLSSALLILQQGEVPNTQLPIGTDEAPTSLDLCGVFSRSGNRYKIKCELWSRLLHKHLTADHAGRLYAIAGQWCESIKYFGKAIGQRETQVQSELFAATISAIHASEDPSQAFDYLVQGLQAAYPDSDFCLYRQRGQTLELVHPLDKWDERRQIPLDDLGFPETEALRGPDYSNATIVQDTRLLIPLRIGNVRPRSIGLASFISERVSYGSVYRRREDILHLVSFLRQAAHAIDKKREFTGLLDATKNRADMLHALNRILTRILHRRDCSEEVMLRLMLVGVTSGWGLEFNRAALFMLDKERSALVGYLGVGHLTCKQAEADWDTFSHQDLDALIDHVLAGQGRETPLHRAIENLILNGPTQEDLVATCFRDRKPVFSAQWQPQTGKLPRTLLTAIEPPQEFALVPLNAVNQTLGMLYVDDKFTGAIISDERFELLQVFANQAALILENARTLKGETRRADILTKLLKAEETVNDHITQSVQGLLNEIVDSACQLIGADCAVLDPLRPSAGQDRYVKEAERVAYSGTRPAAVPTDTFMLLEEMVDRVIEDGLVHEHDVAVAHPLPSGRKITDCPFISGQDIRAFVAVRLGPVKKPIGILYIYWRSPHPLTPEERTIIEVYANFAAVAIPSARRYQQVKAALRRRVQELQGLSQVFQASRELKLEEEIEKETIRQTLQTAQELTGASYVHLVRKEPRGMWQTFWLTSSGELQFRQKETIKGIAHRAFSEVTSILVEDAGPLETEKFPNRYHPASRSGLAVPVQVTRRCLAVLYLESPKPYGLDVHHREFLEHLINGLASTLEQVELYYALRRLLDISLQLTRETDLQSVLNSVVELAMDALRAVDIITLYHIERESDQLVLGHMSGVWHESNVKRQYPQHSSTTVDRVWGLDEPIFAQDATEHELLYTSFARREGVKSTAALPLKVNQERVGCMFFNYRLEHVFDQNEEILLGLFAQSAAFAIQRAILSDDAKRRRERLETVARITPIISANLELDDVFRAILREVIQAVPQAQNACIVRLEEETQELFIDPVSLEFYRVDQPLQQGAYQVSIVEQRGIAGRVMQTGEAAIIQDVYADPDYIPVITSTRSELCVPIIDEKTQAALVLESDQRNAFTPDDQRLLQMLADHVAIAIQNAEQYAELQMAKEKLQRTKDREWRERSATLATGLIHDINSAVANIPDLVTEIEEKLHSGRDVTAPLADLRKNTLKTGRISNRLREFVITGQFKPELVRLAPLIRQALKVVQDEKPNHVTVQYQESDLNPEIMADGLWIELLMENLILNAFRAIPLERVGVVGIEVKVDSANVFIRVKDNGTGIAPRDYSNIFKAGFTTKPDKRRLQGIGLYHCEQIAQEHQGKLKVQSKPGVGTAFTVILPRISSLAVSSKE